MLALSWSAMSLYMANRNVEEEADESLFWLEMITESEILSLDKTKKLIDEANQLTAIFTSIRKTTKENGKR